MWDPNFSTYYVIQIKNWHIDCIINIQLLLLENFLRTLNHNKHAWFNAKASYLFQRCNIQIIFVISTPMSDRLVPINIEIRQSLFSTVLRTIRISLSSEIAVVQRDAHIFPNFQLKIVCRLLLLLSFWDPYLIKNQLVFHTALCHGVIFSIPFTGYCTC